MIAVNVDTEVAWMAWVKAHHAHGCRDRKIIDAEHCRYRAAHIATAKDIAKDLARQGWRLCPIPIEPESVPMFGDDEP